MNGSAPTRAALAGLWRPLLPVVLLLAAQLALRQAGIDPAATLKGMADRHWTEAALLFVPLGATLCFVGVPRQVVALAGGYVFAATAGTVLALLATLLGCAATFSFARLLARQWVARRLSGRLARIEGFLSATPFASTLMLRLLPVGNNVLLCLAAGVSRIGAAPFLAGSAIGYLPQTLVFALVGAGVQFGHGVQLAIAAALFLSSGAIGWWLLRRVRRYGVAA